MPRIPGLSALLSGLRGLTATRAVIGASDGTATQTANITDASGLVTIAGATFDANNSNRVTLPGRLLLPRATFSGNSTSTLAEAFWNYNTTGNTMNYITTTGWTAGSIAMVEFTFATTVSHNAGSVPANTASILTLTGAGVAKAAGATMLIGYNGTNWLQIT